MIIVPKKPNTDSIVTSDSIIVGESVPLPKAIVSETPIDLGLTDVILPGGSGNYYIYEQTVPIATWTITHTFYRPPDVTVITSEGFVILTDIEYPSNTMVVLTFAQPTSGRALLV